MIKKQAIRRIITASLALFILFLICLFPDKQKYNFSSELTYVDEIRIPIYAVDPNDYVARCSIIYNEEDKISYIIKSLTKESTTSLYLPDGFKAVLPVGTKLIDYELEENILKLNFSEQLLNIKNGDEDKIISALTYSLTEIENINKIIIYVNGVLLDKFPNGKSIPNPIDKNYGINKIYDINDIKDTNKTTIYYMSKLNDEIYYVPITKISNNKVEPVEIIIKELKHTPIYETNFISYLNASYELKDYEILENNITVSFNNKLLLNLSDDEIVEKVKYTLALSIRDTYNVENILININ